METKFSRVKYWADVRVGIHSICVLQENLGPNQQQYYANVALKFNLKAGGINQRLPEQLGFLHNGDTMVVGIDVSHPAPKSSKSCVLLSYAFILAEWHISRDSTLETCLERTRLRIREILTLEFLSGGNAEYRGGSGKH